MGFDWRNYNGQDWTTIVKTQTELNKCIAYGTIAALESMLRIHFYYRTDVGTFPSLSEDDLWNMMMSRSETSVPIAGEVLMANGITIPTYGNYRIRGMYQIGSSIRRDDAYFENFIVEAKRYLETNGPLIIDYEGQSIASHCVAIIGYTDGDEWICKDSYPGQIRNIKMSDPLRGLYAILIQGLNISIREKIDESKPITGWSGAFLMVKKQNGNGINLADSDPTFIGQFEDRFTAAKFHNSSWGENCLQINPKDKSSNLDDLEVTVSPDDYLIRVHACVPGSNENGEISNVHVDNGNANVNAQVNINKVSQCAKEILYPFLLDAINKQPSDDDLKVIINALLRTAEVSKEDFIKDLDHRLVDLKEACNNKINRADGTLKATEKIRELVKYM